MLSRRRLLLSGLAAMAGSVMAACEAAVRSVSPSGTIAPSATVVPTRAASPPPSPSPVGPSLRERIGQMLLVGFRGLTVEEAEPTRRLIAAGDLGGILLFSVDQPTGGPRNVESPAQLRTLVEGLASEAPGERLTVAIDQEGGLVARLGPAHGFPPTPSAAELGAGTPEATRAAAEEIARTLASVGVTLNLAPVVDLAANQDNPIIAGARRSFSADPQEVVAHAAAFIAGHDQVGIDCTIKHFPGQGSAGGDTHLGVVDVTDAWTERELVPFQALIDRSVVDAVLTAHIFNAGLDREHPATLSRRTIGGLLRERMGYTGVVISDDLQMGAIRDRYGHEEAVALAIEAGVDVLLIANQLVYEADAVERTVSIVEELVRGGRISEERIDASFRRILAMKSPAETTP